MLFCLGEPFGSLLKHLKTVNVHYVELLDEGFHALNSRRVKALRKIADHYNIEFMVHSPFADINIATPSPAMKKAIMKRLDKSLKHASQLQSKLWIFHPGLKTAVTSFYPGSDWRLNMDAVRRLQEIAEKYEMKIAIENVPEPFPFVLKSVEDFSRFYEELDNDIGITLDIGHANLNRQVQAFITAFREKILHVHVSDNKGNYDAHLGIGHGNINWPKVAKALKGIDYSETIILESIKNIEESLRKLRKIFL